MANDVTVEESTVGPVVHPRDESDLVVLYLHGDEHGPDAVLGDGRQLALLTGAMIVCPRYRPRFPASIIDAHAAYRYCQAAGPVVVVGEGLGASLATAMLVQLRDSEATAPRCAVLQSALLDLTLETRSLAFNAAVNPGFDVAALRRRVSEYARGTALSDDRLSPLYANLHGLPPMRLLVAGTDPLLDDSLAFATRAARSRVRLDLRVWPDQAGFQAESILAMADFVTAQHAAPRASTAA
ncbi:alpha/beta hydrolase [Amycolatopsis sp. K13G38]|uniref:Alpha/beta hydrolase n=1 Tax=Amycolatopsis acididurans TaxID=2724524 RepID=A0ABX1IVM7_9PSEU|nr:alpha/beta hydrolase fold domain-containing protein [Amycolatopsis acididurans]NKQ51540.1 alpha/beta hydrolase [Amycolatopsis acididurans]